MAHWATADNKPPLECVITQRFFADTHDRRMFSCTANPYPWLMINGERSVDGPRRRQATGRGYLMCPPEHFAVTYAINPWMEPETPTDAARAMRQWAELRQAY